MTLLSPLPRLIYKIYLATTHMCYQLQQYCCQHKPGL